jgi:V/A-type H+-transporting ATPase subunit E
MKMLEKSKDKIQEICNVLKLETLKPAEQEAQDIIAKANQDAKVIIQEANKAADDLIKQAKEKMRKDEAVFNSALLEASKQSIERLKQEITENLFNVELQNAVIETTNKISTIDDLITCLVDAVKNEGLSADFSAIVANKVSPSAVNAGLKKDILDLLKEKSVVVGDFKGGAKLKLHDKKMTIEITDDAVVSLIEQHLRKDFRKWLFKAES